MKLLYIIGSLVMLLVVTFTVVFAFIPEAIFHTHEYVSELTKEAACAVEGEITYTCRCGDSYTEKVSALGHTEETVAGKAATCTEAGITDGKKCSVCGETLLAQEEIAPYGHHMVIDEAVAPTCTETGLTEGSHCSRCDGNTTAQEVVPALGHKIEVDEAVAPTCNDTGLTQGEHCTVCDYKVEQEIVDALGHDVKIDASRKPTCTETGLKQGYHCSRCDGYNIKQDVVPALGHSYDNDDDAICNTCGHERSLACKHTKTEAIGVAKDPTCTEAGITAGLVCLECNEILEKQQYIDKLGHDIADHDAKDPTCTEVGNYAYEACSRCNYTTYEEIPALGHDIVVDAGTEATCTEAGLSAGEHCTRCDHKVAQEVLEAKGHSYAYTTEGTLIYGVSDDSRSGLTVTCTCSVCGNSAAVTEYTVNLADSTISVGEDKVPVTMALNYVGGEHTLTGGTFASIAIDGATLNINGNVTVTGTVTANDGKLNFLGGSSTVNGTITTTNNFLLVTGGAVLTVNSNVKINSAAVANSAAEFGYDHRFAVIDGTVNVNCSFVGGAIEANSIVIGSVKNNTKGILNLTNTASKGNGFDNIGALRWVFANGEVNCVGNEDKTGTAVCMGKSGKGYIDFLRGMTFNMKNYDYGIGEWYASSSRYIGVEKGLTIKCENVNVNLHAQKNTYLYTHSYVEMEYTHEGKTGLAIVNIEYASQTFKGDFDSFDAFVFPTADNYNKVTSFVAWVETE